MTGRSLTFLIWYIYGYYRNYICDGTSFVDWSSIFGFFVLSWIFLLWQDFNPWVSQMVVGNFLPARRGGRVQGMNPLWGSKPCAFFSVASKGALSRELINYSYGGRNDKCSRTHDEGINRSFLRQAKKEKSNIVTEKQANRAICKVTYLTTLSMSYNFSMMSTTIIANGFWSPILGFSW